MGLFGPDPEEPDWQGMWIDYVNWSKEDTEYATKELGNVRAQMAARGIRPGSTTWTATQDRIRQENAEAQSSLVSGATVEGLKTKYNEDYTRARRLSEGHEPGLKPSRLDQEFKFPSFNKWGIGNFGLPEGVDELDPSWKVGEGIGEPEYSTGDRSKPLIEVLRTNRIPDAPAHDPGTPINKLRGSAPWNS